jgi:hypothetical protein
MEMIETQYYDVALFGLLRETTVVLTGYCAPNLNINGSGNTCGTERETRSHNWQLQFDETDLLFRSTKARVQQTL